MTATEQTQLEEAAGLGGFDPSTFKFKKYSWLRMARLSGEEGDQWVTAFMATPLPRLIVLLDKALGLLRRNEVERGRKILQHVDEKMAELEQAAEADDQAMPLIVPMRWTLGIEAYLHYLDRRYDKALETLDRAESIVKRVLATYGFLTDMALAGKDFTVQRARVARNQRDWAAMDNALGQARGMVAGEVPLLRLEDGREIFIETVVDHYRQCRLNEVEREALEYYFDTDRNLGLFDVQTWQINFPSGFIVPYQ